MSVILRRKTSHPADREPPAEPLRRKPEHERYRRKGDSIRRYDNTQLYHQQTFRFQKTEIKIQPADMGNGHTNILYTTPVRGLIFSPAPAM